MSQSHLSNFSSVSLILLLLASYLCYISHVGVLTAAAAAEHQQWSEETDRLALLAIKSNLRQITSSNNNVLLTSWNSSVHPCSWEGIACGLRHQRVTVLDLTSSGLSGTLSPAVGNLSFLQYLKVKDNKLQGQIPSQISFLTRLQYLSISYNSFTGQIPSNLSRCYNLQELYLGYNRLQGTIPLEFTSLVQLQTLSMNNNNLTGTIDILGNLTSLAQIDISVNGFDGEIPPTIGTRLKDLTFLSMGGNSFTGPIPSSIYNLSKLIVLDFGGSHIYGTLPEDIGFTLPFLQKLHIMDCRLYGRIPASINNLTNIEMLDLSKNRLSGRIPLDGSNLPNLMAVHLAANKHLGTSGPGDLDFLDTLVNCTKLYDVILILNNLGGTLPSSVADLPVAMKQLSVGSNVLSGEIPEGLDKLVNLQVLNLNENRFTGGIPDYTGRIVNLSVIDLSYNNFSGTIPASLGNLLRLNYLDLGFNQLQGDVPSSLGQPGGLQYLSLQMNELTGNIPPQIFSASSLSQGLYLNDNRLWGPLPEAIGQLANLGELDVSYNKLSGKIPQNLGKCSSLTKIYMTGNFFSGSIPELGSLKGLSTLDLSSNNLTGPIPTYLSGFTNLVSLNLSHNNLEGEVPSKGVFASASHVSLAGNRNICGGISQLHLPKCPSSTGHSKEKKKRTLLLILLISIFGLLFIVTLVLLLLFHFCLRNKHKGQPAGGDSSPTFLKVSYNTLLKATEGFASKNLLGIGSFGSVYRGVLDDENGKTIAVAAKVLNLQHRGSAKSFIRECEALRNIRHRNLISIISACSTIDFQGNEFKALVYELMPRGSLDQWLHSEPVLLLENGGQVQHHIDDKNTNDESGGGLNNNRICLNLLQRINIAIDVACALDYLHNDCETPIVHCDLKPSNILLDNNMVAHVGDFGLARLIPDEIVSLNNSSSAGVQGTIGYAPPEYGLGNQISASGDVYSYGIILLEMMTATKPTDQILQNTLSLHDYARTAVPDNVLEIADPNLLEADEITTDIQGYRRDSGVRKVESLISTIKVGVECSAQSPKDRMSIKDVIRELNLAKDMITGRHRV